MGATLVVGGKSEFVYVEAVLDQAHPWAQLTKHGADVADAKGDGNIPDVVQSLLERSRKVVVLYDRDALGVARQQASVIEREGVPIHVLESDFEGAFDSSIIQRALAILGYQARTDCLEDALVSRTPFSAISSCCEASTGALPLDKARLALVLATVSQRHWYVPRELYPVFMTLGELCDVAATQSGAGQSWLNDAESLDTEGRLYVCNHVSNAEIAYWYFSRRESFTIPLPQKFDGSIAVCRRGQRFITRKWENKEIGHSMKTWVHVFDLGHAGLELTSKFQVPGLVSEVAAEEDGNHMQLWGRRDSTTYGVRCLQDGTQQEKIAESRDSTAYGPTASKSGRFIATGRRMLQIEDRDASVTQFAHFDAQMFVWSPCERFVAFFGRRWHRPPDFLWLYDLRADRVYRFAAGERFMPVYWTARS